MKEYQFCELDTIGYWELCQWRDACEYLSLKSYRWQRSSSIDEIRHPIFSFQSRERRKLLWDLYKIQLIRWCSNPKARFKEKPRGCSWKKWESNGWQLVKDWEVKINFLEKVIILDVPYTTLSMPWKKESNPNPWDAVLAIPKNMPRAYDAVLGGIRK